MSIKTLMKKLRNLKKFNLIAVFGGLTTVPELQSNQFSLERLIHDVISMTGGNKPVRIDHVRKAFQEYNCSLNDPAENLFVSVVEYEQRNFMIFEGIWEGNSFYLQRFIDILDSMPNTGVFEYIKEATYALLLLSDEIVKRSGLNRNAIGSAFPIDSLPVSITSKLKEIKERVIFSESDLYNLGINHKNLIPFIINDDDMSFVKSNEIGNSELEKKPIVTNGNDYAVVLPSAISPAIRRFIIDFCITAKSVDVLQLSLIKSYCNLLYSEFLFRDIPVFPNGLFDGAINIISTSIEILSGRYLHYLFVFDDFSGYENGGLMSVSQNKDNTDKIITEAINIAQKEISKNTHFRDGVTLVVTCGWGRMSIFKYSPEIRDNWVTANIELKDLITLGLLKDVDTKRFWKFLQALEFIDSNGIININLSGLLNSYTYAEIQDGHFYDHAKIVEEGVRTNDIFIVQSSNLQSVRHRVAMAYDNHLQTDEDGEVVQVSRLSSNTYFNENKEMPIYGSITHAKKKIIKYVYESGFIDIWVRIINMPAEEMDFMTICNSCSYWIHKSINVIKDHVVDCDIKKIAWELHFTPAYYEELHYLDQKIDLNILKKFVHVTCEGNKIVAVFDKEFINGFHDEGNEAEKCMLWTLLEGLRILKVINDCDTDKLIEQIVTSKYEKQLHLLTTKSYEYFITKPLNKPIYIDIFDNAYHCLGLTWGIAEKNVAKVIYGKRDSVDFINKVVSKIFSDLQAKLNTFDLRQLIIKLVHNLISVKHDEEQWTSTLISLNATHKDKENVQNVIDVKRAEIKSASLSTRLLIEIALCECKAGTMEPDEIDISFMMTLASSLFEIGGWSDAVLYELIPAEIRVSCLGNILIRHDNIDKIVKPYSTRFDHNAQSSAMENYSEYFRIEKDPQVNFDEIIEEDFMKAWLLEFGFKFDNMFLLFRCIEEHCSEIGEYFLEICKNDLILLLKEKTSLDNDEIIAILDCFVFVPRLSLTDIPDGYLKSDWHPWKFTRKLSILSKPVFQLDNAKNPTLIIVPSFIRAAIPYFIQKVHGAEFEARSFYSEEMKRWNGNKRSNDGHRFNAIVRDKFIECGWFAEAESKLSKILQMKFDNDFGDIDVLAWDNDSKRVLLVECKDLQFAKTYGDVAIQLDDFKGILKENGKPDRLLKHIRRCDIIMEHKVKLAAYLRMDCDFHVEKCILFSGNVPMMYSEDKIFNEYARLSYDDIANL